MHVWQFTDSNFWRCSIHLKGDKKNNLNSTHINIASIRNKVEMLAEQVKGNADMLINLETKLMTISLSINLPFKLLANPSELI